MDLKVPYLKVTEIDRMVAELFARYERETGEALRPPVDVDKIVERFLGLDFEVVDLKARLGIPDVIGAVWFDDKVIRVDESLDDDPTNGRFAFTLGHEIGHWVMHRPIFEMDKVTLPLYPFAPGQAARPAVVCRDGTKGNAEWQANQFASRLLMPVAHVRSTVTRLRGSSPVMFAGIGTTQHATDYNVDFRDFANEVILAGNFLNVSNQAMRIRLVDLKLVADANDPQTRLF